MFQNIFICVTVHYSRFHDISEKVSQDIILVGSLTLHATITGVLDEGRTAPRAAGGPFSSKENSCGLDSWGQGWGYFINNVLIK